MVKKKIGSLSEFIVHPGESLKEILTDRNMMQKELANRTGFTEKHISSIINGQSSISVEFAMKLECVLGVDATFWINLQSNYETKILEYLERENIAENELHVLEEISEIRKFFVEKKYLNQTRDKIQQVLDIRRILGISNLELINNVATNAQYRMPEHNTVNTNVLFAWVRACELETETIVTSDVLDVSKLKLLIPSLKAVMFEDPSTIHEKLTSILAKCGIKFNIIEHFAGAPVQGFIKKTPEGNVLLCLTTRRAYADIFWFSLMHEIAHIVNGDISESFVDFSNIQSQIETRADKCAADYLLNASDYTQFVMKADFSISSIVNFADIQKVKPYIVIGRLKKEKLIPYNRFADFMDRYHLVS